MKKKIIEKKRKFFADNERGVMMIKNFPHGFYEKEMYKYFSQFGKITRLKIIRSRKVITILIQSIFKLLIINFFPKRLVNQKIMDSSSSDFEMLLRLLLKQ